MGYREQPIEKLLEEIEELEAEICRLKTKPKFLEGVNNINKKIMFFIAMMVILLLGCIVVGWLVSFDDGLRCFLASVVVGIGGVLLLGAYNNWGD